MFNKISALQIKANETNNFPLMFSLPASAKMQVKVTLKYTPKHLAQSETG